jgi:hypothetical protein
VQRQMQASVSLDPPERFWQSRRERLPDIYTANQSDAFFLIYQLVLNQY